MQAAGLPNYAVACLADKYRSRISGSSQIKRQLPAPDIPFDFRYIYGRYF